MSKKNKHRFGITDWKFIILLLGIFLTGLSVLVLNQKITYQSSASSLQSRDKCFRELSTCKAQCQKEANPSSCRQNCDQQIRGCLSQLSQNPSPTPSTTNQQNTNTPTPPGLTSQCYNDKIACKNQCQSSFDKANCLRSITNCSAEEQNLRKCRTGIYCTYDNCENFCVSYKNSLDDCKRRYKNDVQTCNNIESEEKRLISQCRQDCETKYKSCMQN